MKIPEYYIFKTIVHDMKTKLEVELQPIELDELLNKIPEIGVSIPLEEADIGLYINVFADDEPAVKAEKIYQITKDSEYNELIKWLLEYFEMRAEPSETYIKRSDAVKAFAEYLMHDATTESPYASVDIEDWTELAEDILNDVPPVKSIRKKAAWISVNERLPEINESGTSDKLLLCWSDGQIVIGHYMGDNSFIGQPWPQAADATVTVTAWMYAPEPYVGV